MSARKQQHRRNTSTSVTKTIVIRQPGRPRLMGN